MGLMDRKLWTIFRGGIMDDCNQSDINKDMLELIKGISDALASQLELLKLIVVMVDEEAKEALNKLPN